jgi:hypothetical protein
MHRPNPERGYALTLMLVLLVTGSLYLIVNRLDSSAMQAARTAETARALQQAKSALIAYALTYRESHPDKDTGAKLTGYGYLPCPDLWGDDVIGMHGTAAGTCGNNNAIAIGLLPYRSLGLPELRDGDGNCLWYAVSGTHKNNPNTNPLNWDTRGQIEVLDANGITILSSAGTAGGAVAVIFAAGPAINNAALQQTAGRSPLAKPCSTDSTQAAAYLESLASPMSNGTRKSADGSLISNDRLLWISATELYTEVLKRGTEFPAYVNLALTDLAAVLNRNYSTNNPSASTYRLPSPLVMNVATSTEPVRLSAQNFAYQWADHLRFRKCTGTCTVLGSSCAGVLIWSGIGANTPRTAADYLETNAQNLINTGTGNLSATDVGSVYDPATPSKDVALCLNPA